MKKIVLLTIAIMLPFMPCVGKPKKDLPIPKDGWYADAGKHIAEPASEKLKQAIDTNTPILSEGMKGLGKEFGQVMMQNLPQNILLSGAIVMGTVVVSKVTDSGIRHVEKTISGELAFEQIENRRKELESYQRFISSHSNMQLTYKQGLIALREFEMASEDLLACRKRYVYDWIPFTRKKMYCDSDNQPIECQSDFLRLIATTQYPEKTKEILLPMLYQKNK